MLRQEGYYIGVGLSNLINLLDPDVIVLAGGMAKADKYFRYSMMNEIRRHACFPFDEDRIRVSELNDKVVAYGAYVMVKKMPLTEACKVKFKKRGEILCRYLQ